MYLPDLHKLERNPDLPDGTPVKALWEDRRLESSNGIFRDVIPGVGAVVYEY